MRDLQELREYDAGAPPLDVATRWRVRARLLAAIEAERSGNAEKAETTGNAPAPRPRRPVLRIALATAVAAAVTGGVAVSGLVDGPGGGSGKGRAAGDSPLVLENVSAQTVLKGAATYARQHEQAARPRNDQFIYTKELVKKTDAVAGDTKTYTDENWTSVDDSKPSWVMEVGKGWWSQPSEPGVINWPPLEWTELEKLPTDPTQLILRVVGGNATIENGKVTGLNDGMWSMVHLMLTGLLERVPVMPDGLRAAAFEALGLVPGTKVVSGLRDARGRVGVGVTYDDPERPYGTKDEGDYFLFDPTTYAYLGYRVDESAGSGDGKVHEVLFTSLESWAVVDRAKQRP